MLLLLACATPEPTNPSATGAAARAKDYTCPVVAGCACEENDGRTYLFCTTAKARDDAEAACEAAGHTLADVEDATENAWLWARAEAHHAA